MPVGIQNVVLVGLINNQRREINRITMDIERYRQGIDYAHRASEQFKLASKELDFLTHRVSIVFKGKSADEFIARIIAYKCFCDARYICMQSLINSYEQKIVLYEQAKKNSERILNILYITNVISAL